MGHLYLWGQIIRTLHNQPEGLIILGQGIAGTTLAWQLWHRGIAFMVVDDQFQSSSSLVAAGLWNPIVFRRINKSWEADTFISHLEAFYPKVEKQLGKKFFHPLAMFRVHSSEEEARLWSQKISLSEFAPYLGQGVEPKLNQSIRRGEYGASAVHHTGYLDVREYLESSQQFFKHLGQYQLATIPLESNATQIRAIVERDGSGTWPIIDCRGSASAKTRHWNYLPFGLTKGEVLTISSPAFMLESILNAGFFTFPVGESKYRLGATFDWSRRDDIPTAEGRLELTAKFEKRVNVGYEVIDHRAGVRPTVLDRRPLIGQHPDEPSVWIFNGLGTKGVMLAPYLGAHLLDHLFGGLPLNPEVDIQRFRDHYVQPGIPVHYPGRRPS